MPKVDLSVIGNKTYYDLVVGDYFDLDSGGLCDELYIEAAAGISLPVAGLDAELFMIRPPADEWQDHLAMNIQINDFQIGGQAILWGHGCLGFIEFGIPLSADLSIESLLMGGRYSMWLDNVEGNIELQDEFTDVVVAGLDINTGGGALLDGIAVAAVQLFLLDIIEEQLLHSGGAIADIMEGLMDGLYKAQPCACMMLPSHHGKPPVSHILVNVVPFLLPVGFMVFLRRRTGR